MNHLSKLSIVISLVLTLLPFGDTQSLAEDSLNQAQRIRSLLDELRCPSCQGLSVNDSVAGFSINIRKKAAEMVLNGYTDDEIRKFFVERYGEWILRTPPMEGFNLVLWVLPIASLLFGFWFISSRTRRWVESESIQKTEKIEILTPEEEKQVEADLKSFRGT